MNAFKLTGRLKWEMGDVVGVDVDVDAPPAVAKPRGVPMMPLRSGRTMWDESPDLLSGDANTLKSA